MVHSIIWDDLNKIPIYMVLLLLRVDPTESRQLCICALHSKATVNIVQIIKI